MSPTIRKMNLCLAISILAVSTHQSMADEENATAEKRRSQESDLPLLAQEHWDTLDTTVDKALAFLAKSQNDDGSFETHHSGQPGVTSLCAMAFLSRGHLPNDGAYQETIRRAVDYTLNAQAPDGTIMVNRVDVDRNSHFEGNYNHAISALMLTEVYGMTKSERQERVRNAIEQALKLTRLQQKKPKRSPDDHGGWRYMKRFGVTDSDLSATAWQLMFLRSARNAEFDVPEKWITEAMEYVRRTFDPREKAFRYGLKGEDDYCSRAMAGAGIVALSLGGEHDSDMARSAGDWILKQPFRRFNQYRANEPEERYHYSSFYCSQAMFQLGGDYWHEYYPRLLEIYAKRQRPDGSWEPERLPNDRKYGRYYSTAMAVLALSPPYQVLPIYQR